MTSSTKDTAGYLIKVFLHEWDRRKYIDTKLTSLLALSGVLMSLNIPIFYFIQRNLPMLFSGLIIIGNMIYLVDIAYILSGFLKTWRICKFPLKDEVLTDLNVLIKELKKEAETGITINDEKGYNS